MKQLEKVNKKVLQNIEGIFPHNFHNFNNLQKTMASRYLTELFSLMRNSHSYKKDRSWVSKFDEKSKIIKLIKKLIFRIQILTKKDYLKDDTLVLMKKLS